MPRDDEAAPKSATTRAPQGRNPKALLFAWGRDLSVAALREAVADGARGTSRVLFPTFPAHLTILEMARILRVRRYTLTLLSQME